MVIRSQTQRESKLLVVFSFAKEDESFLATLKKHLMPLERQKLVETWDTNEIKAGEVKAFHTSKKFKSADLFLLLVSGDFLASDLNWKIIDMMSPNFRDIKLIPIIIRPCDWRNSPLGNLQPLPRSGQPISTWPDQDLAFLEVTNNIREIIRVKQEKKILPKRRRISVWPAVASFIAMLGLLLRRSGSRLEQRGLNQVEKVHLTAKAQGTQNSPQTSADPHHQDRAGHASPSHHGS